MTWRPALEGKAVRLRPPTEDDLEFAHAFANDEDLRGWLRFYRPATEMEELEWIQSLRDEGELVWLIESRAGEPLGFCSLHVEPVGQLAELGIGLLGDGRRGQGHGTDAIRLLLGHAFGALRLQRVYLHVVADNPAARLYERLGFRREGTLRRHTWKRGAYRDQHVMAILREEWSG